MKITPKKDYIEEEPDKSNSVSYNLRHADTRLYSTSAGASILTTSLIEINVQHQT